MTTTVRRGSGPQNDAATVGMSEGTLAEKERLPSMQHVLLLLSKGLYFLDCLVSDRP